MAIFTMLILPIHYYGRSLHFLRSSSISFLRDLKLLSYRSFICLVRVTPKIFYAICGYCEGNCFPNFFLSLFILWGEKGHWFVGANFYPVTAMKLFIRFRGSLVGFLGSLIYTIISSAKSHILTSSFPICIPLISFCCRIALANTSSTMLKR